MKKIVPVNHPPMKHFFPRWMLFLLFVLISPMITGKANRDKTWKSSEKVLIYTFDINKEIGPAIWRITKHSFLEAQKVKADLIIIHMNTYGGMLDAADSIRTIILNSHIPVYVFIDNNAASAGALISIAADRIYMREGASIGAATVVNQTGEALPDKYQSFMRSMMRSTCEAHGKDTVISGRDTLIRWHRDPRMAEAMVDPRTYIPGVNDSGKVLTFTTEEAIKHHFCEGKANSLREVIQKTNITNFDIREYKITALEKLIGFLVNPFVQGILIMIIVAGIYFEMQSPGIFFPIGAALLAAVLYFAPLYLEGLAQHWEMLLFVIGLILIALEIFVIPGFGITGITGISLVVVGLSLSMLDNNLFELNTTKALTILFRSLVIVITSIMISLGVSIYLSQKLITSSYIQGMALHAEQKSTDGYKSFDDKSQLVGLQGVAITMLRPSGKIQVEDKVFDAFSEIGFIDPGEKITVTKYESGQIYVRKNT
jgi:membrane-bound serine protease (ClpP class)